jgi:NhaP-type Na+/H+ or K+/H+ antiporter
MDAKLILLILPILVIFSYLFDALARRTKFPSIILLLVTGITARFVVSLYGEVDLAFLDSLIPVLGTIGLILIVMEGALELRLEREKAGIILRGFLAALLILLANVFVLSTLFEQLLDMSHAAAVLHAIPLSIISSAVAIPSASGLSERDREFVVYESTFSDILGIMFFYYAIRQFQAGEPLIGLEPIGFLGFQIVWVILLSVVITFVLLHLLQRIQHNVKFFLILALLILVYAIGKYLYLPALVTIFIFGLCLGNVSSITPEIIRKWLPLDRVESGLHQFHVLTAEFTFLVRTFFFLFFGFSISVSSFVEPMPYLYGAVVFAAMLGVRYLYLAASRLRLNAAPLVYMSPRGLISILLFLQIGDIQHLDLSSTVIDKKVLLVIIALSILVMIRGAMQKVSAPVGDLRRPVTEPELPASPPEPPLPGAEA